MRDIQKYSKDYLNNLKFEDHLVRYRRKKSIEFLKKNDPSQVIEIGCAAESAVDDYVAGIGMSEIKSSFRWNTIEPSEDFIELAKSATTFNKIEFYKNFFEDVDLAGMNVDESTCIICAGLLHEIPSLDTFMKQIKLACDLGAKCHISVPNSHSLHRVVGQEMGVLEELHDLSDRNIFFQHHTVFSNKTLKNLLLEYNLKIVDEGGYLIKPFTHTQMEAIDFLDNDILDGLYGAGEKHPDLATEIYINFSR